MARSRLAAMRERVRIERPVEAPDGMGGRTRSWQEVATVWAEVSVDRAGLAREQLLRGAEVAVTARRIRIRFREDVDTACRLAWRGRLLDVTACYDPDGGRHWLLIDATEGGVP